MRPTVCVLVVVLLMEAVRAAAQRWPEPVFHLSFDKDQAARVSGIRGQAVRVARGGQPIAFPWGKPDPSASDGSIVCWWRPEWNIPETQRSFGQAGSLLQGFYAVPVDRPFASNSWHQVATTWNENQVVRHYVDGELVARGRLQQPIPFDDSVSLWLGCDTIWSFGKTEPPAPPWSVTVDEFNLFATALSTEEIQALFLAGKIACQETVPEATPGDRALDLLLGQRILVTSRDGAQYGYPAIASDEKGTIYLKAHMGGEFATNREWRRSTDEGRTWTPLPPGLHWAYWGARLKGGKRIITYWYDQGSNGIYQGTMDAVGADDRELLPDKVVLELPIPNGKIIATSCSFLLPDGILLGHAYVKDPATGNGMLMLIRSADEGRTWKYVSTIVEDPLNIPGGALSEEETVLPGAGNSLTVICRTGTPLIMVRSDDNGQTWSRWNFVGAVGVAPRGQQLSNGLLACSFGRPDVNLLVSLDEHGKAWSAPIQVYNANRNPHEFLAQWHQHGTFYAAFTEVAPGRLFVAYDTTSILRSPGELPQSELWLQEVLVDSVPNFARARKSFLPMSSDRLKFRGDWVRPRPAESEPPPYAATSHDRAEVGFSFEGTGFAAQLMMLPDGGDLEVWVDGQLQRTIPTAGSQTYWLVRRVLARHLRPGTHQARLIARNRGPSYPALPSIQELMVGSPPETILDRQGATRVVLHAIEPFEERAAK